MRWFPRKSRQTWVLLVFIACMLGVYFAYSQLRGNKHGSYKYHPTRPRQSFDEIQEQLKKKVKEDLRGGKKAADSVKDVELGNIEAEGDTINEPKPDLAGGIIAGRVLDNEEDYVSPEERLGRLKLLLVQLSPTDMKVAPDPDEIILLTKSEFMDLNIDSKMSCREIDFLKSNPRMQGFHGKKYIDYMKQDQRHEYVIKSVGNDHQLKVDCMKQDYNAERCYLMANYKLLRELVFLIVLDYPGLIKLHGFCLRGDTIDMRITHKGVMFVTESGRQLQKETMAMMPFANRLEVGIHITKLLMYLESSPFGSLGLDHMHMADFVQVDNEIKLVDLDDIHIGEPTCVRDSDCKISEKPMKEVACVENVCKGYNSWRNLLLTKTTLLSPLMKYPPNAIQGDVDRFLSDVEELKMSQSDVLHWFQKQLTKMEGEVVQSQQGLPPLGELNIPEKQKSPDLDLPVLDTKKDQIQDPVLRFGNQEAGVHVDEDSDYRKVINGNFPGRYDYQCPRSRVSWGCVLTVYGLAEAKLFCDEDTSCESFVIFSQHPETDAMMTMVKKNGFDESPDQNYGATIFRKQKRKKKTKQEPIEPYQNDAPKGDNLETNVANKGKQLDKDQCMKNVLNFTKASREKREKRLYTHLGMRDLTEREWITFAQTAHISKHLGLSQLSNTSVKGGRLKIQYKENNGNLKKGEYVMEYGPSHYHIGFLVAYHLDRLLGLYHVPPVVARSLSTVEHSNIQGKQDPLRKLTNATDKEGGWLQGVITVSVPTVMKTEKLTIPKLSDIVDSVHEFSRNQKIHLEYVLIWALTKMMQPTHGFLGYKGHLIHFEGDLAFGNLQKILTGYFYSCQFPNMVLKTLNCYRCSDTRKVSKICGLGIDVITRIRQAGFMEAEVVVGELKSTEMAEIIDNTATSILMVVEHCVKIFSREKVIY